MEYRAKKKFLKLHIYEQVVEIQIPTLGQKHEVMEAFSKSDMDAVQKILESLGLTWEIQQLMDQDDFTGVVETLFQTEKKRV